MATDVNANHSEVLIRLRLETWTALQLFEDPELAGLLDLIRDLYTVAQQIDEDLTHAKQEKAEDKRAKA